MMSDNNLINQLNPKKIILTLFLFIILLTGCSNQGGKSNDVEKQAEHQNTYDPYKKIREPDKYVDPKILKDDPAMFFQAGLFDNCLGLEGYQNKDFFEIMLDDLELELDYTLTFEINEPDWFGFSGTISDACYSESLRKMILLSTSADMNSAIAVIEYDVDKRKAGIIFLRADSPVPPEQFGARKENIIEMKGNSCRNFIYLGENPSDSELENLCHESFYVYDLAKKEIRRIYERRYTPTRKQLGL